MQSASYPLTHDLVLIGGGHSHALVLRRSGMNPLPGARLTLINPGPTAPYSGMLPGFVAGHYHRSDLDIDLVRLARFAGARLILGAANGIDLADRQIHVPGRPSVAFDVCSVDIGVTSDMPSLPGFADHGIPAKPLGRFAERWSSWIEKPGDAGVVVIGGGVAGAELAMAMAHALARKGRSGRVTLVDSDTALAALGPRAKNKARAALQRRDVTLVEQTSVVSIGADHVLLSDGQRLPSGFVTGVAGARPYNWLAGTGLALTDGFLAVDRTLRTSDPEIFAVGDCAHLSDDPRPKAGVYAVRQAPVLFANLCAAMTARPMRRYKPQKDYLKLISLGEKSALGERFGLAASGPLVWRWKDRIDQRFMSRFRDLPQMSPPSLPSLHTDGLEQVMGSKPLCGGCGAKVGRHGLNAALSVLEPSGRADIQRLPGDDAALLVTGSAHQVLTSDHLRSFSEDPVLMARIAAVHALGDIWAMGAAPQAATASIILPALSTQLQRRTLSEIMAAATKVMRDAGAEIVGGHTSVGAELTIGFSVTGLCSNDPITLAGGRPGDALILVKPLGTGVLMAAEMAGLADGAWITAALEQMSAPQSRASALLEGAHAMTDVTGFGLAGHLLNICEASGVGAVVDLAAIPLFDGALNMAEAGVQSSIYDENRSLVPALPEHGRAALLFDPQTAGGLLAAVAPSDADGLVNALQRDGYPHATRIGALTKWPPQIVLSGV